MAIGKWIGGALGWIASGGSILGALAGYCIGSLLDDAFAGSNGQRIDSDGQAFGGQGGYGGASSYGYDEGERNSFLFSMLVLASYIIKADGKIMHSEMEYVRSFLRQNFGAAAESQGEDILMRLFDEQKRQGEATFKETIRKACLEIRWQMDYSMRLQLLSFLAEIARADGRVTADEIAALKEVAQVMGLSAEDVESVLAMGSFNHDYQRRQSGGSTRTETPAQQLANAYKVLGIAPTATNDEVKKAYRQMALKHHPDRVATLGEDVKRAAEKKFKEINEAKDLIYKSRGI